MFDVPGHSPKLASLWGWVVVWAGFAQAAQPPLLDIPASTYVPVSGTVEVRLDVSPTHARVEIDGLVLAPSGKGDEVQALATPGRHALKVTKDGHAALTEEFDVPGTGFNGHVWLAPIRPQATVHLTSGRKLEGVLVSQDAHGLTLQRGAAKFTLSKEQYDVVELAGLAPAGESYLRIAPKPKTRIRKPVEMNRAPDAKGADEDEEAPATEVATGKTQRAGQSRYPEGFKKAFYIPKSGTDQHGNPLATRSRKRRDRDTGWPYEFWLRKPRMEFVLVSPGEFLMGGELSPQQAASRYGGKDTWYKAEQPQRRVHISNPFYLGKYEVTNAQYRHFRPSHNSGEQQGHSVNDDAMPVASVSWEDAAEFCEWLSQQAGARVRLPTEAEWEYACRAGTTTPMYWGTGADPKYCNTSGRDDHVAAAPVGKFRPNALGLFDMLGNAAEWCSDRFAYYQPEPQTDPQGSARGQQRVLRGGSWRGPQAYARAAARRWRPADRTSIDIGFRCVVEAVPAG